MRRKIMRKVLIALVAVSFMASPVFAADAPATGEPNIDGAIQLNVQAGEDVAAAIGNESEADQELGNIDSGNVTGDIEDTVVADQDVSAAIGNESTAKQKVGTIGGH